MKHIAFFLVSSHLSHDPYRGVAKAMLVPSILEEQTWAVGLITEDDYRSVFFFVI